LKPRAPPKGYDGTGTRGAKTPIQIEQPSPRIKGGLGGHAGAADWRFNGNPWRLLRALDLIQKCAPYAIRYVAPKDIS